jgi:hypothetical protein
MVRGVPRYFLVLQDFRTIHGLAKYLLYQLCFYSVCPKHFVLVQLDQSTPSQNRVDQFCDDTHYMLPKNGASQAVL